MKIEELIPSAIDKYTKPSPRLFVWERADHNGCKQRQWTGIGDRDAFQQGSNSHMILLCSCRQSHSLRADVRRI